jgi:hypothetical protein
MGEAVCDENDADGFSALRARLIAQGSSSSLPMTRRLAGYAKLAQEAVVSGLPYELRQLLLAEKELAQRDDIHQKRRIIESSTAQFPSRNADGCMATRSEACRYRGHA